MILLTSNLSLVGRLGTMPPHRFWFVVGRPTKENILVFKPSMRYILIKVTIFLKGIKNAMDSLDSN